jgi:hypothetical protein
LGKELSPHSPPSYLSINRLRCKGLIFIFNEHNSTFEISPSSFLMYKMLIWGSIIHII